VNLIVALLHVCDTGTLLPHGNLMPALLGAHARTAVSAGSPRETSLGRASAVLKHHTSGDKGESQAPGEATYLSRPGSRPVLPLGQRACVLSQICPLRGGGIAGFQRWFTSEFPEAVIHVHDGDGDIFDHVAFDMNGLLHTACLKAKTLEHAVLRIFRELDATLRTLQPRKSVVLAFDGPGPLAKLLTQRKRRLKASRQSKYKLSGLNITPGPPPHPHGCAHTRMYVHTLTCTHAALT